MKGKMHFHIQKKNDANLASGSKCDHITKKNIYISQTKLMLTVKRYEKQQWNENGMLKIARL